MITGTYKFKLKNKKTGETKEYSKTNIITNYGISFLFSRLFNNSNSGGGMIISPPYEGGGYYGGYPEPIMEPVISLENMRMAISNIPSNNSLNSLGNEFLEKMFFISDDRELIDDDLNTTGLLSTNMKFVKDSTSFEPSSIDISQPGIFTKTYSGVLFSGDLTINAVAGASESAITTYTKLESPIVKTSDEILSVTYSIEYTHPWIELQESSGSFRFNEVDYTYNITTNQFGSPGALQDALLSLKTNDSLLKSYTGEHSDTYRGDVIVTDTGLEIITKHIIWVTQNNRMDLEYQLSQTTFNINNLNTVTLDKPITLPEVITEPIKIELPGTKYTFNFSNFNRNLFERIINNNRNTYMPSGPSYPVYIG